MAMQPPQPPSQQPPDASGADQTLSGSQQPKAEFISPQASPQAVQFIQQGRRVMYDPGMMPAVKAALGGAKDLATGIAMFVAHLISKLEDKLGQLSDQDFQMVVAHLCGSMVDLAQKIGEPTATQDSTGVTKAAIQQCMQLHQQGDPSAQSDPNAPPDPGADPSQASPMAQFGPQQPSQGPPQ